jgi:hypothetical protein
MSKYKWTFVSIAVIALLAGGVSGLSEINFWLIFLVMFGSILFTGIITALEDDMPGGYNNPDGTDTPKNTKVMSWIFRAFIVLAVLSGTFTFIAKRPI